MRINRGSGHLVAWGGGGGELCLLICEGVFAYTWGGGGGGRNPYIQHPSIPPLYPQPWTEWHTRVKTLASLLCYAVSNKYLLWSGDLRFSGPGCFSKMCSIIRTSDSTSSPQIRHTGWHTGSITLQSQGWEARPHAGLSLLKVQGRFNTNSTGADIAYILHTQNVLTKNKLNFSVTWKISIFTNATNIFWHCNFNRQIWRPD